MTTLAGAKIKRYRTEQQPRLTRASFGRRFGAPVSTVQGWEEEGKKPRADTMNAIVATGIVNHADWFTPARCWRCEANTDAATSCNGANCPLAIRKVA